MIDALKAAVEARSWEAALAARIAAWRSTRAPELGDLVDMLALRVLVDPVPSRLTADDFEEVWQERAGANDDATTGALVASLGRRALVDQESAGLRRSSAGFARRLDRVAQRAPDPRIALAIVRFLASPPAWIRSSSDVIVTSQALDLVVANADARSSSCRRAGSWRSNASGHRPRPIGETLGFTSAKPRSLTGASSTSGGSRSLRPRPLAPSEPGEGECLRRRAAWATTVGECRTS